MLTDRGDWWKSEADACVLDPGEASTDSCCKLVSSKNCISMSPSSMVGTPACNTAHKNSYTWLMHIVVKRWNSKVINDNKTYKKILKRKNNEWTSSQNFQASAEKNNGSPKYRSFITNCSCNTRVAQWTRLPLMWNLGEVSNLNLWNPGWRNILNGNFAAASAIYGHSLSPRPFGVSIAALMCFWDWI